MWIKIMEFRPPNPQLNNDVISGAVERLYPRVFLILKGLTEDQILLLWALLGRGSQT